MTASAPPFPTPPSPSLRSLSRPGGSHPLTTSLHITAATTTTRPLTIKTSHVRRQFARTRINKARGTDDISPRLLKVCMEQLAGVFPHFFGHSLGLKKVPTPLKTSYIILVLKKGHPSAPNNFRTVSLTSHVMKTFERLVLQHLRPLARDCLDPQQFEYQTDIGVEDAIIYLLHRAYTHLDRPQSMVRITFFDFSSAFFCRALKPTTLLASFRFST